jgi:hypothetical protein
METVIRLEGLTKYYGKNLGVADLNLEFIQERLRLSRRLSRKWGSINQGYSEQGIRQVALSGITEQTKKDNQYRLGMIT